VSQWVVLLTCGVLVIVVYRQLGRVFGSKTAFQHGPARGTRAEGFEYRRVSDQTLQHVVPGEMAPLLIAFVNPTCPACSELVSTLNAMESSGALSRLRILLLISEPTAYLQVSEAFTSTVLEVGQVLSRSTLNAYKATATPLMVAIRGGGAIAAVSSAADMASVTEVVNACFRSADLPIARSDHAFAVAHERKSE
jgi:hypothetical protein